MSHRSASVDKVHGPSIEIPLWLLKPTAVAALAGMALAGCSEMPTYEEPTKPASSSSSETSSPETTPTPKPTSEALVMPDSLQPYKDANFEAFSAFPKTEQAAYYCGWQARDMKSFADEYVGALSGAVSQSDRLPSQSQSIDNTDQQALTFAAYNHKLAFSIPGEEGKKALVASFYDPSGEDAARYNTLSEALNSIQSTGSGVAEAWMQGSTDVLPVPTRAKQLTNGATVDGTPFRVISSINPVTQESVTTKIFLVPYTDPITGEPASCWLE